MIRKAAVISISVFLTAAGTQIQALTGIFVNMIALVLHMQFRPYICVTEEHDTLQKAEMWALTTSFCTLWAGLLFYQPYVQDAVNLLYAIVFLLIAGNFLYVLVAARWYMIIYLMDMSDMDEQLRREGMHMKKNSIRYKCYRCLHVFLPEWRPITNWADKWKKSARTTKVVSLVQTFKHEGHVAKKRRESLVHGKDKMIAQKAFEEAPTNDAKRKLKLAVLSDTASRMLSVTPTLENPKAAAGGSGKMPLPDIAIAFAKKFRQSLQKVGGEDEFCVIFRKVDKSGDGYLSRKELSSLIKKLLRKKPSGKEVSSIMALIDVDGSGSVSMEELHAFLFEPDASHLDVMSSSSKEIVMQSGMQEEGAKDNESDRNDEEKEEEEEEEESKSETLSMPRGKETKKILPPVENEADVLVSDEAHATFQKLLSGIESPEIITLFKKMDKNGDGALSVKEGASVLKKLIRRKPTAAEASIFFKKMDGDNNGSITKEEFLSYVEDVKAGNMAGATISALPNAISQTFLVQINNLLHDLDDASFQVIFSEMDQDSSGCLCAEEASHLVTFCMEDIYGTTPNMDEVAAFLRIVDIDNSGKITLGEFKNYIKMTISKINIKFIEKFKNSLTNLDSEEFDSTFQELDKDSDGKLNPEEVALLLENINGEEPSKDEVRSFTMQLDEDRSGYITKDEIKNFLFVQRKSVRIDGGGRRRASRTRRASMTTI